MQIMPDGAKTGASRQFVIKTALSGHCLPDLAGPRRFLVTSAVQRGFLPGIETVY
jgi:hypothetical protein